jgi:hypothetical protein
MLAEVIDKALTELASLKEQAKQLDDLQGQISSAQSHLDGIGREIHNSEGVKARLLVEVTTLRQQAEQLRAEKNAERQERQAIINEANENLRLLAADITAKQGQRDHIASSIAELKGRLG